MPQLTRYIFPTSMTAVLLLLTAACSDGGDSTGSSSSSSSDSNGGPPPAIELTEVARGFTLPVSMTRARDGSGRFFVVEREGLIRILEGDSIVSPPFLDLADRITTGHSEQGLLGLAFPPDYAQKQYFYVCYTDTDGDTVVSRFSTTDDADVADPDSEEVLLQVDQPYDNHNGGQLAFGPDGYLYIGLGDGGSGGDPQGNGQDPDTLLGAILRIDVEGDGTPYSIPADNPFGNAVWAYGLRNPWRFSFDRNTDDLYIADVGQRLIEEIDFQPASSDGGENYGWNIMEGSQCYSNASCDQSELTLPVAEYDHQDGDCSVTGGYVYRGAEYPDLQGIYFYGDYCSGKIWGLQQSNGDWAADLVLDSDLSISSFGEDEDGNIYVIGYGAGTIFKLEQSSDS